MWIWVTPARTFKNPFQSQWVNYLWTYPESLNTIAFTAEYKTRTIESGTSLLIYSPISCMGATSWGGYDVTIAQHEPQFFTLTISTANFTSFILMANPHNPIQVWTFLVEALGMWPIDQTPVWQPIPHDYSPWPRSHDPSRRFPN